MGRPKRITLGGYAYHVFNRANAKSLIFRKNGDFLSFEKILAEAIEWYSMRLCGYCIMGNHWHLLLWPVEDDDLSAFMQWVTLTHTQRFHVCNNSVGTGHLYQGRFKSFPVQDDEHYLTVLRYIEANPLRAKLVKAAEDWPWSSLTVRDGSRLPSASFALSSGPLPLPENWLELVNLHFEDVEKVALDRSFNRGIPFGDSMWQQKAAKHLCLGSTLRPRGRPKKGVRHLF